MKFSVITPSYENAAYLEECLFSVLNQQGNFFLEHIVVDGASSDNSIEILKNFEKKVNTGELRSKAKGYKFKWISEKDCGMYDAILKGFEMSNGNIMAWINADDKYQEGALQSIFETFEEDEKIQWIKGITDYIERDGTKKTGRTNTYNRNLIKKGVYGTIGRFIQQDSVFWRRELWNSINHDEIRQYKLAGDFRLWQLFAEKEKMHSIPVHLSYFRKRDGQLSSNINEYYNEAKKTTKYTSLEKFIYNCIFKIEKILRN